MTRARGATVDQSKGGNKAMGATGDQSKTGVATTCLSLAWCSFCIGSRQTNMQRQTSGQRQAHRQAGKHIGRLEAD